MALVLGHAQYAPRSAHSGRLGSVQSVGDRSPAVNRSPPFTLAKACDNFLYGLFQGRTFGRATPDAQDRLLAEPGRIVQPWAETVPSLAVRRAVPLKGCRGGRWRGCPEGRRAERLRSVRMGGPRRSRWSSGRKASLWVEPKRMLLHKAEMLPIGRWCRRLRRCILTLVARTVPPGNDGGSDG